MGGSYLMAYKFQDGKSYSTAVESWGGLIKSGMFGTFNESLDEEITTNMEVWKPEELVKLVETGKIRFDCVGVQTVGGVGPNRVLTKNRESEGPSEKSVLRGKEGLERVPG
jgi:hypothetical protein